MSNSTTPRPRKPSSDFPLFVHDAKHPARSRWAKKIRGAFHYFGKWIDDQKGERALELWLEQRDDLLAGRRPRPKLDALTVKQLADEYLHARQQQVITGELNQRTWTEYRNLLSIVADVLGRDRAAADIQPDDWAKLRAVFAGKWGPSRLGNAVVYTRSVWKWAFENRKLAAQMVFGSQFSVPSAKVTRAAKNAKGPRLFRPEELHAMLDVADTNFQTMLLLSINCGLGPTDLAFLPIDAIDLKTGWINYPRRKTSVPRKCPLWAETLASIRAALATRPDPRKGFESLLFLDASGKGYTGQGNNAIWRLFTKTAKAAGVKNRTPYDARRSFLTISERAKDPIATASIMGWVAAQSDMSAVYRQAIDASRLEAVVDVVREWLYGTETSDDDDTGQNTTEAIEESQSVNLDADGPVLLSFSLTYAA